MMKRRSCVALLLLLMTPFLYGGVGTWRNYTSMKDVAGVARGGSTYWAATSGGLFSWSEANARFQTFTNAEGLQSTALNAVAVDAYGNIWAGSTTGIISVYTPSTGVFRTITDIADNRTQTDKSINSFAMVGDTVLICTDFCLSVFRISQFQFGDTYSLFGSIPVNTKVSVFGAAIHDGSIWASISDGQTHFGVASASLSSPNLTQPAAWTLQALGLPTNVPKGLAVFHGTLYAGSTGGLYAYAQGTWDSLALPPGSAVVDLSPTLGSLLVCTSAGEVFAVDSLNGVTQIGPALPFTPTSITGSVVGQPVVGCLSGGILSVQSGWVSHLPNGPSSNEFSDVAVDQDGIVWCASGVSAGQGLNRYDGTSWLSFPAIYAPPPFPNSAGVYRVSVSCNGSAWASTWGGGVAEFPRGSTQLDPHHIYGLNVGMLGIPNDNTYLVITNVVCDSRGNNWMSSLDAANHDILVVRTADGTWIEMPALIAGNNLHLFQDSPNRVMKSLAIDFYDDVWAVVRDISYKGLMSLWNGGTIDSTVRVLVTSADGLASDQVNTIVVDGSNTVWVGTDKGISIILDPLNPKGPGGIAAYKPLTGENINAIAVDPLNQKWVATPEGVVLLSADGTQELASYTVESTEGKLIDNNVNSIAVDPKSGTVYFATSEGLASLTTVAATPKTSFDALNIYPNPFRVPAAAPLTVDGLMANSTIKILTIDGRLVRQLTTPGGRVGFWDGKDTNGNDVATGVYIVVVASEDGTRVINGKVAVLKK